MRRDHPDDGDDDEVSPVRSDGAHHVLMVFARVVGSRSFETALGRALDVQGELTRTRDAMDRLRGKRPDDTGPRLHKSR